MSESFSGNESVNLDEARVYDWLDRWCGSTDPHREDLARNLRGTVLDLGGGTGQMLPHFASVASEDLSVHLVDPNPGYRAWAEKKTDQYDFDITIREGRAESIPYDDDSFDAVLCSTVLCSVDDTEAALAEIRRVLRANGEFRFVEHVHADGFVGHLEKVRDLLVDRYLEEASCELANTTDEKIADSEFDLVYMQRLDQSYRLGHTFVKGTATPSTSADNVSPGLVTTLKERVPTL